MARARMRQKSPEPRPLLSERTPHVSSSAEQIARTECALHFEALRVVALCHQEMYQMALRCTM